MAVMITSGSMPFSLASASIVCCSGLVVICLLELHVEPGPLDVIERDPVPFLSLGLEDHRSVFEAADPSSERGLPVDRFVHHDLGGAPGEALVIARLTQGPIEAGRRHLEGVRTVERVLDVENDADLAAHHRAILDADAVLGSAGWTRLVDEDSDDPARGFATQLDVEQLEAVRLDHSIGHRPDQLDRLHPFAETSPTTKSRRASTPVLTGPLRTIYASTRSGSQQRTDEQVVVAGADDFPVNECSRREPAGVALGQEHLRV